MSRDSTLWVFGHSSCLPFSLSNGIGWADQLSSRLGTNCKNFAEAGADNLFIYHSFISNLPNIKQHDIVIIGWSHPNRKSFVLDSTNHLHINAVSNGSIVFAGAPTFFRSKAARTSPKQKWLSMTPRRSGDVLFDQWFENYHSSYECRLNLQSYLDSVQLRTPCKYLPFYFSRESVDHVDESSFYWLDFIISNRCWISETDTHPSQLGHNKMADIFLKMLDTH
jgi:hypothetical protein